MIPARMTVVTLGVQDMPAMRAFYRNLGWREKKDSSDGFASFLLEGAILALFPFEELAQDGRVPTSDVGSGFRGITLAVNVETKELVDATIDQLRANGAAIKKEPEDASWGGRSAYFADPEGNLWEVVWAPGAFDVEGRFTWGE